MQFFTGQIFWRCASTVSDQWIDCSADFVSFLYPTASGDGITFTFCKDLGENAQVEVTECNTRLSYHCLMAEADITFKQ